METINQRIQVIGRRFRMDVYPLSAELFYESEKKLTFTIIEGAGLLENGYTETVTTRLMEIRPNVYLAGWKEKSGATVTHVEDYEYNLLYTNITMPNGDFYTLQGSLLPVGA